MERSGDCAQVYGKDASQPIYLDSNLVGNLRSKNHHTGRPLDMALIEVSAELRDIGIENIVITGNAWTGDYTGCTEIAEGRRFCVISNQELLAADTTLEFGVSSDVETWRVLRDAEEYMNQISAKCTAKLVG